MKYCLSLLLIAVFLGLNIFGFLAFNHKMDDQGGSCFASTVDGTSCPLNVLNYVLHHFLALQMFTKGLIATSLNFLLLLVVIGFLLSFWFLWHHKLLYLKLQFTPPWRKNLVANPHQS